MSLLAGESLYAQIIGWEVLNYLKKEDSRFSERLQEIDSRALQILEKIRAVLDDDAIDDPECFERIDQIVNLYFRNDIGVNRHDWG